MSSFYQKAVASIFLLFVLISASAVYMVKAADPDPLQDFCVADLIRNNIFLNGFVCKNPATVTPTDFTSKLLRSPGNVNNKLGSAVTAAVAANFPGLNTQGLSFVKIEYAVGGVVAPHNHPRASEILFVANGVLLVGFLTTNNPNNKLFSQVLYPGDLWVFPRGLVHFIQNVGNVAALSFSALNSQNPGTTLLPNALFASSPLIPNSVLQRAFQISEDEVNNIEAALKNP